MNPNQQPQNPNLRQKLAEIRKSFKTFAITEDSDKKGSDGKAAYKYTPGWAIVEAVKEKMDAMGVMLEPTLQSESHEMITYPVYKEIKGQIIPFEKKEMYVSLVMAYTFVDVATGEAIGPFLQPSAGANGTDKSIASALSLAERYFLLKYFQFTTREMGDEPDAHDSSSIPGKLAQDYPNARSYNAGTGYIPKPQTPYYSAEPVPGQQPAPPRYNAVPQAATPAPSQASAGTVDLYEKAAAALMMFQKGTPSHNDTLQIWMNNLSRNGYNTAEPSFAQRLVDYAQAKREHNVPAYAK